VRPAVLRCVVVGADGEGGLWWPESMMEAACMHVWAPRRAVVRTAVLHHHPVNCISLFKKTIIVTTD
jgi:hypothetical protein